MLDYSMWNDCLTNAVYGGSRDLRLHGRFLDVGARNL